ncbi:MAG: CRTAC1 family protein [Acidobacteria bacterium]|nr:CRTAC1 family protein [Acidobacteriota bacterium]
MTSGTPDKLYIPETNNGGVGLIDYNNDGWSDIYFINGSTIAAERQKNNRATNHLYRNNRDGTFTDVTEQARVGDNRWGMGVCSGDVNNDGFDDLYVANLGPNVLYLNSPNGTFKDFSKESGTADPSFSSSCAFGDYDKDGDLDLYVSNYLVFDINRPPERAQLGPNCVFYGLPVMCGPLGIPPAPDRFYENTGDGKFVDATNRTGIGKVPPYNGMGVVWGDFDNDGNLDIYVANDRHPNYLFHNNGNKTFSEIGAKAGAALSAGGRAQAGMGVDSGDYDNDGDLDLLVTNFSEDYNTIYRNDGKGNFTDVTPFSNTTQSSWLYVGWGTQWFDADLDGALDFIVANGHVFPQVDGKVATIAGPLRYKQRALLYRNTGNNRFEEIGATVGFAGLPPRVSRGLAMGDLNNDGRLDAVIGNLDDSPMVLADRGRPGNWLLVKLRGTVSNKSAIGARVIVRAGSLTQIREVKSGGSYNSQSDFRLHFGLGSNVRVDEIVIRWPGGTVQAVKNVPANRTMEIQEQ